MNEYLDSDYLTREEVAQLLGVSTRTVDSWRSNGVGPPSIKVGGTIRYRKKALEEWISEKEQDTSSSGGSPDRASA